MSYNCPLPVDSDNTGGAAPRTYMDTSAEDLLGFTSANNAQLKVVHFT